MPYKYFQKLIFGFDLFVLGLKLFKNTSFLNHNPENPEKPPRALVEVVVKVEGEVNVALALADVEHDVGLRQGEVGEE